jgi:predicted DNA-binding transcriptional regulator YafY
MLLQAHGKLTAQQLAERLEVSERTIYRDMDALSAAGFPIVADRGQKGGWRLLDDYRSRLSGLKASELQSLFLSPSDELLADLGLSETWESARQKLIASLPVDHRKKVQTVWNRIHIDTSTWKGQKEELQTFEVLKQAIWQEKKVHIVYKRADGLLITRDVDPLGLVAKGSRWYFVAAHEGELRNYRVSRIRKAEQTEEAFIRPANFDLAAYWKTSTQSFVKQLPTYPVQIEARETLIPRLTFTDIFVRIAEVRRAERSGWFSVQLIFDTKEEAKRYLLGFATDVRVIEPSLLQQEICAMAEAMLKMYT